MGSLGMDKLGMDELAWWQSGVVYQIYPRSFQDSDGDGIGDLAGIARRLDHLVSLGVDALWLSPIQPSPMADFGYDVADYCGVEPIFGQLADFDALVRQAHARGLRVILDFVPNHSADRHPWFLESRGSRASPKRDWYIWHDPAPDGGPPNNWLSHFGGSAWEWDQQTGQFYLHSFLAAQPDLNWRNPAVRAALYDALRFWLDRGVDGFRVDVIWLLIKDALFRDNPANPGWKPGDSSHDRLLDRYTADQPEVHGIIAEMRAVLDGYEQRLLIGEIHLPIERLVAYYGKELGGAHLPFNVQLIRAPWNAREVARIIQDYEAALPEGAWPNWVLGNHDQSRIASRVGPGQARIAAMLLLTLRGTPTLYYGEEIGMRDVPVPPEAVRDPAEKNQPGIGLGRDPQRTPMLWDGSENAGFSTGDPWLPMGEPPFVDTVESLSRDAGSILSLYRDLIALRRGSDALTAGRIAEVQAEGEVLSFLRIGPRQRCRIMLNMGGTPLQMPRLGRRLLLSTHAAASDAPSAKIELRPGEGIILEEATL